MSRDEAGSGDPPAVVMAGRDGRVVALDGRARRLLGDAVGRSCWEAFGALPDAEGLPCRKGCVGELLRRDLEGAQHVRLRIGGRHHSLSCVPIDGVALCVLTAASGARPKAWQRLTARELDVLRLLSKGQTTAEMANALGLGEATVRTHVEHMRGKLGVTTRAALVARAFDLGLLG